MTTDDAPDAVPLRADPARPVVLAFVCVRNAGRSQMASAFAERERAARGLEESVDVVTGGTDPADRVHPVVVEAMREVGVDLSDREPRAVSEAELADADVVVTMGCSTLDLPGVDDRDWALPDPGERPLEEVREIREEVADRVHALFDGIEAPPDRAEDGASE
ncbi:low molecular weight phosphatase family protein [Haloparvum alkalitolerans]|uniref:arsenate-mycothiol transferase ArsC n=1 Tax=Haloparvum alkalitolerans TaxID=1042953 RepID=UPI003CE6E001